MFYGRLIGCSEMCYTDVAMKVLRVAVIDGDSVDMEHWLPFVDSKGICNVYFGSKRPVLILVGQHLSRQN